MGQPGERWGPVRLSAYHEKEDHMLYRKGLRRAKRTQIQVLRDCSTSQTPSSSFLDTDQLCSLLQSPLFWPSTLRLSEQIQYSFSYGSTLNFPQKEVCTDLVKVVCTL